jgi:hypothetical protein
MRSVNRFDVAQYSRISRNSKIIYQLAKYGSKGLSKVNPTLVFIDAVVSLGELFIAYSEYRQVREQNKRLEIEIKVLKKELKNFQKSLELHEQKMELELAHNAELIERRLRNNREAMREYKGIYKLAKESFFMMKETLQKYQKELPNSQATRDVEKQYQEALIAYTEISLQYIGG